MEARNSANLLSKNSSLGVVIQEKPCGRRKREKLCHSSVATEFPVCFILRVHLIVQSLEHKKQFSTSWTSQETDVTNVLICFISHLV